MKDSVKKEIEEIIKNPKTMKNLLIG